MNAAALTGRDFETASPPLARMGVAVISLVGLLVAGYLSLYKLGFIGELQCTIGGCELVQASSYAFFLGVPVAVLGVVAYAVLLVLALMGVQPRWVNARWIAVSIFVVSGVGVLFSAYLTSLEAFVIHAWCQWCVGSAVLITLAFLLSIPGFRDSRRA